LGAAPNLYVPIVSIPFKEGAVRRLTIVGAGVIVSAVIAMPTFAGARGHAAKQHTQSGAWVICREQLVIHSSPPLTPKPHPAKFTSSDVLDNCSSSDPTIDRGVAIVKNKGPAASCGATGGGQFHGIGRVRWNNGKITVIRDFVSFAGGIAIGHGKIIGGTEFAGRSFKALDKAVIDETVLGACASPVGLGVFVADGEIQIGHKSIGGVNLAP
jgi:hypothetical protein